MNRQVQPSLIFDFTSKERKKSLERQQIVKFSFLFIQFRAALQMVVSAGDPREDLENFMKIGEGSTGTVCIATYKSTGKEKISQTLIQNVKLIILFCDFRSSSCRQENGFA